MNGTGKAPGQRSRPTNNQLLYKAHFRWAHYTSGVQEGTDMPEGTEACASVTSAFLQVLATINTVEAARLDKARNILQILSTNTRRTKVVELATGTHRCGPAAAVLAAGLVLLLLGTQQLERALQGAGATAGGGLAGSLAPRPTRNALSSPLLPPGWPRTCGATR